MTIESMAPWLGGALVVGGILVALTRRRELVLRWCIWAVGVPVIVALFWWGDPGAAILAGSVAVIAALEYGALVKLGRTDRVVLAAALIAVVLTTWWEPQQVVRVVAIGLLALAAVPLIAGDSTGGLRRISAGALGLVWISPVAALVPLGATALTLFVAVSVADIVAFFAGPRLGGPRLCVLSPAKRWSGTVVGSAAAVGVVALMDAWTWPVVMAVAVGGPVGDLFESMVKRGAGAKDSGRWLAGAGGLLDRIDSMLFALAVVLVLS